MLPQQQPNQPDVFGTEPSPSQVHEEQSVPNVSATAATSHSPRTYMRPLIGLAFLCVSLIGGLGVIVALMPSLAQQEPQTQLAAAAAHRNEVFDGVHLVAKSAYVYDVRRDSELFSKNAMAQLPLASITKVMLALVVSEVLPPDSTITINKDAVVKGGGGLTWGEEWKVRDLIDYTLITSSNTGAEALADAAQPLLAAKYPDGSKSSATIWRMNALAQELGMRETYFLNASGLDESPTQAGAQSSARDIAMLFAYALRTKPDLFSGTTHTDIPLGPLHAPEREAHNTNNALADIGGLLMGKTGTTDLAGGNLAIAFLAAPERPVVIVVLGSTDASRYDDMQQLVAAARAAVQ